MGRTDNHQPKQHQCYNSIAPWVHSCQWAAVDSVRGETVQSRPPRADLQQTHNNNNNNDDKSLNWVRHQHINSNLTEQSGCKQRAMNGVNERIRWLWELAYTAKTRQVSDHVSRTLTDEWANSVDARGAVLTESWERTTFVHVWHTTAQSLTVAYM